MKGLLKYAVLLLIFVIGASCSGSKSEEARELTLTKDQETKVNDDLSLTYEGLSRGRIKLLDQNQGVHLLLNKKDHKNPFYGIILEIEETDENQIRVKIYPENKSNNPLSPPGA